MDDSLSRSAHLQQRLRQSESERKKRCRDSLECSANGRQGGKASLQAGIDFNSATLAAPTTIVYSVYSINDGIIKGLINTEPDVQTLAGNLKGVIPDNADNLAGIKQAQSATSQSTTAMGAASANQPAAVQVNASKQSQADDLAANAQYPEALPRPPPSPPRALPPPLRAPPPPPRT